VTRLLAAAERTMALYVTAGAGLLATIVSILLVLVPPSGTANVLNYEANLILQTTGVVATGFGLYLWSKRNARTMRR